MAHGSIRAPFVVQQLAVHSALEIRHDLPLSVVDLRYCVFPA